MKRTCLTALACAGLASGTPQALGKTSSAGGLLIVTNLPTAPFPHPERANGHTYQKKSYSAPEHYASNAVAIFVPKGFCPGASVDFIVHLHGWNNNIVAAPNQYQLYSQLTESRKNAVLVLPEGPYNAPDSFAGKLEDTNGFKALMDDVLKVLRTQPSFHGKDSALGKIVLSCHSGGYRGVAAILDRGGLTDPVSEVWLFDALYAETDKFLKWIEGQPSGRLVNIYTEHGGTKEETEQMIGTLKKRDRRFSSCREDELTPLILRARQPLFISTPLGHNDVLHTHQTFRQLLETSSLDAQPDK